MPVVSSQARRGNARVLRSSVPSFNPLLLICRAHQLRCSPVSSVLHAVKSADLSFGAGSDLVTLGKSLCSPGLQFPPPCQILGSFLLSVVHVALRTAPPPGLLLGPPQDNTSSREPQPSDPAPPPSQHPLPAWCPSPSLPFPYLSPGPLQGL